MSEQYRKGFCKIFETLTYKHSKWDVWYDFIQLTAYSIANTVPVKEKQAREEKYLSIINKYEKYEQNALVELFANVVAALEDNPAQDYLGTLYHQLNLQQHQKGQFFTPYHVSEMMSEINFEGTHDILAQRGYVSVSDPACGAGAMLIAFANTCLKHGVNYQNCVFFEAQDIDYTAALMCYIQLSLLGCCARVIVGDSLLRPGVHPDNEIFYTPMYYMNRWKFTDFLAKSKTYDSLELVS